MSGKPYIKNGKLYIKTSGDFEELVINGNIDAYGMSTSTGEYKLYTIQSDEFGNFTKLIVQDANDDDELHEDIITGDITAMLMNNGD